MHLYFYGIFEDQQRNLIEYTNTLFALSHKIVYPFDIRNQERISTDISLNLISLVLMAFIEILQIVSFYIRLLMPTTT